MARRAPNRARGRFRTSLLGVAVLGDGPDGRHRGVGPIALAGVRALSSPRCLEPDHDP